MTERITPEQMSELAQFGFAGMTNLDQSIEEGFEEALRAAPNRVFGRHAAWEFNGLVWFDGEQFCEEVWRYHSPIEIMTAPTLRELMCVVNDKYGYD
jgi:hypothetical protein